jgi:hypothetical protein
MNGDTLRAFFEDRVSAVALNADLEGAFAQTAGDTFRLQMTDLDADFFVTADHLVKLCDAVLAGALDPEALRAVGFGVIGSDHFNWDPDDPIGARVGHTLYDWASTGGQLQADPSDCGEVSAPPSDWREHLHARRSLRWSEAPT